MALRCSKVKFSNSNGTLNGGRLDEAGAGLLEEQHNCMCGVLAVANGAPQQAAKMSWVGTGIYI